MKDKFTYDDKEITAELLDKPLEKDMVIFLASEAVSLWPKK